MKKLFYASLILLFICDRAAAQKIVGGQPSADDKPFYARIVWPTYGNNTVYASGTLIAPNWILTSGVAVTNMFINTLLPGVDAIMGSAPILSTPASARITGDFVARHPGFGIRNGYIDHDIALVHLSNPVHNVIPIGLPAYNDNSMSAAGTTAIVLGHGLMDTAAANSASNELRMAIIEIIANDTCNLPSRHDGAFTPDMLCAGRLTGAAAGPGAADYGGPLYVETSNGRVQVGIVSMPEGQQVSGYYANSTRPGIFTRVASYRRWIDSVITDYNNSLGTGKVPVPQAGMQTAIRNGQLVLHFAQPLNENAAYLLYSMDGRVIAQGQVAKGNNVLKVDAGNIPPGICLLRVSGATGWSFTSKCYATP